LPRIYSTCSGESTSRSFYFYLTKKLIYLSLSWFINKFEADVAPLPTKINASFSFAFMHYLIVWRASSLK
jgi:ABC-type arginine transport system permease subunit